MAEIYEDKTFESENYTENGIYDLEFYDCTFDKCDFSNAIVSSCKFNDCTFVNCNLSMMNPSLSVMNNISFDNCKILGVKFNHCHDFIFEVNFKDSTLDYSSFERRKMSRTRFTNCSLKGVDFGGTDLKQAKLIKCNLNEAIFQSTNLQEVDFTSAVNYIINPDENNIKKARFSRDGIEGLLHKYNIIIE